MAVRISSRLEQKENFSFALREYDHKTRIEGHHHPPQSNYEEHSQHNGGQRLGGYFDEFGPWHVVIDGRGRPFWSRLSQFCGFFGVLGSVVTSANAIIIHRNGTAAAATTAALSLDCAQGVVNGKRWWQIASGHW